MGCLLHCLRFRDRNATSTRCQFCGEKYWDRLVCKHKMYNYNKWNIYNIYIVWGRKIRGTLSPFRRAGLHWPVNNGDSFSTVVSIECVFVYGRFRWGCVVRLFAIWGQGRKLVDCYTTKKKMKWKATNSLHLQNSKNEIYIMINFHTHFVHNFPSCFLKIYKY